MTTMTDDMPISELARRLGVVEGRLDEMSVALQDLKEGQRELRADLGGIRTEMRADLGEIRTEMRADQRETNARIDQMNDRLNAKIDRLLYVVITAALTVVVGVALIYLRIESGSGS